MSALPWFKFYPGDYLADTQRLTQAQHGAYILLLLDYYSSGPPPDDDRTLMSIARSASLSDWKAIRLAIARYFEVRDGKWFHPRCELEISRRQSEHDKKSVAGKNGNKIKWASSQSDRDANRIAVAMSDTRSQIPETIDQKSEPESRKTRSKAFAPQAALLDVDPQIVSDWLAVRKTKKVANTETAFKSIRSEAEKAGLSMQAVLTLCCERGWASFKASWDRSDTPNGGNGNGKFHAVQYSAKQLAKSLGAGASPKVFDDLHGEVQPVLPGPRDI